MTIRDVTLNDTEAIRRLLAQLGYPDFTNAEVERKIVQHTQPGYRVLVSEENGQVIGFISLHWFDLIHHADRLGRITAFCVDESFRSRKVGRLMLEAAEALFREQGCERVEVTSNNRRTGAHRFYLNLGYSEPSRRFAKDLK